MVSYLERIFLCFSLLLLSALINMQSVDIDDSVHYRIDWKPYSQMPQVLQKLEEDSSDNQKSLVYMTSADNKNYVCAIPSPKKHTKKTINTYSGPTPLELIEPLHKGRICFYWFDAYWTYKLCHGRYIVQYHEEKEGSSKDRAEYYLGNYAPDQAKQNREYLKKHSPPILKVGDEHLPYFGVIYKHGTVCDLTGKPRTTVVKYVCKEGKEKIYSSSEVSTCNYEIIVLNSRLCTHPAFKPDATAEYEIKCYSKDSKNGTVKPQSLIKMEQEDADALNQEYNSIPSETVDATLLKITNIRKSEYSSEVPTTFQNTEHDDSDTENVIENEESKDIHLANTEKNFIKPQKTTRESGPDFSREALLLENKSLLTGRSCLRGGGIGWWKYEFCYGKSVMFVLVIQFHDDGKTGRVEVLLGSFNKDIQKLWINQNPQKRPLKLGGKVQEVYHIYSGGDLCEAKNFRRSVEVRIRCAHLEGSSAAVSLSLSEPTICQYILRLESPRFCEILQEVDEYGLIQISDSLDLSKVSSSKAPNAHTEL
uniref:Endoplasmic reticulum lectin 1 n=1 Tax=Syphacia muris TaxID=451379 RepID=A0A0N5ARP5_9BILA